MKRGRQTRTERIDQRENAEDDAVLMDASQVASSTQCTDARPRSGVVQTRGWGKEGDGGGRIQGRKADGVIGLWRRSGRWEAARPISRSLRRHPFLERAVPVARRP